MGVSVITPGKLVRVEPDALDANDILAFGAALIDEHGHKKGDSGNEKEGWSIHGAIGEAAKRATDSGGKDSTAARPLRDAASDQLEQHHNQLGTEFKMNDDAPDAAAAAQLMRDAIKPYTVQA